MRYSIFGYLIGEGFRNVFKNKKSTMASLIIMCATMFVFGIFFLVGENVNYMVKTIEEQQGMEVFIKNEATEAEISELGDTIRTIDGVNTIVYKTKEDALNQVKAMFKEKQELIAAMCEGDNNPFKASYVVTLTDLNKTEEVQNKIMTSDIVSNIEVRSKMINTLIKVADGIRIVSGIILIILIFISIFIITNTIKLTVHARRKEISIMKYVGATNGFIRWPFMVEGMIIGIISVLISLLILGFTYNYVIEKISISLANANLPVQLLDFSNMFTWLVTVYLILGIGIGAIGSAISMKKYLEV